MWHQGIHWFSGYGLLGLCLNMVIIIGAIFLISSLFPSKDKHHRINRDTDDSLTILKKRLARGEITEEDFHRTIKNL